MKSVKKYPLHCRLFGSCKVSVFSLYSDDEQRRRAFARLSRDEKHSLEGTLFIPPPPTRKQLWRQRSSS